MAAIAITKPKPTEEKVIVRAKAPKTGGARHPCIFCDSKGYSRKEEQEQRKLLSLMIDCENLRHENYRREKKLRYLDKEMENHSEVKFRDGGLYGNHTVRHSYQHF